MEKLIIEEEKKQAKEIANYIIEKINQKVFNFKFPFNIDINDFTEYINKGYFKGIMEIESVEIFKDILTQYFIITLKSNDSDEKYYVFHTRESVINTIKRAYFNSNLKVPFDVKITEISKENLYKALKDGKIWMHVST